NAAGHVAVLDTMGKQLWDDREATRTDITAVSWSPDNRLLAVATKEGEVQLRNSETGKVHQRLLGHPHYTRSVQFTPDGQYVSAGTSTTSIWVVATGERILTLRSPPWGFSPDGKTIALGSPSAAAFGELIAPKTVWPLRGHKLPVNKLAWSRNSCRLM